jgi:succinylarginine dihydrolase
VLTPARWDGLAALVERCWPKTVAPDDLLDPELWATARAAQVELQAFIDAAL